MLSTYRAAVSRLPATATLCAARSLGLPPYAGVAFYAVAERKGICHADLVLALLHQGFHDAVELLIGKPIARLPAQRHWFDIQRPMKTLKTSRGRISAVGVNRCLPTTDAFQRFRLLHVGMTVEQALSRGVRRRDLREWSNKGWMEMEHA